MPGLPDAFDLLLQANAMMRHSRFIDHVRSV